MNEEKILTCYEWFEKELKKDCKIPNDLPEGSWGDPSILEPLLYIVDLVELYAEYYYEMKMKQ